MADSELDLTVGCPAGKAIVTITKLTGDDAVVGTIEQAIRDGPELSVSER